MNGLGPFTHSPKKNFLPNLSIPKTANMLLGRAAATVMNDSRNTLPATLLVQNESGTLSVSNAFILVM